MKLDLEWYLERAVEIGNRGFIDEVNDLRWDLHCALKAHDPVRYNYAARQLNGHGATIALLPVPPQFPQENPQMGMFDSPVYLTGNENGFADVGDTFWLHNARIAGMVRISNQDKEQAKLLVSHERDSEQVVVYSAGAAIVNQVKRMDASDRAGMPMEVRLDQLPSRQGNPTNIMTPADQPAPTGARSGDGFGDNGNSDF